MTMDFDAELRAATQLTRAHKLAEATRVIQDALGPRSGRPRRPLGQTVDLLRHSPRPALDLHRVTARPAHEPGATEFLARSFVGPSGTRSYKLFVPRQSGAQTGLVVMLHGCTQDPDDFALGTAMNEIAEQHGLIVAYPAQSRRANHSLCWNWFEMKDQTRGAGEPDLIAGLTRSVVAEFGIDPGHVYIAGLSAGGAMAAVMAAAYPDIYAAVGIHSGLEAGAADDLISAMSAMRGGQRRTGARLQADHATAPRTIVFHGDADRTVHPSNGESIVAGALAGLESPNEITLTDRSPGGMAYRRTMVSNGAGPAIVEHWLVHGMGHAWSGGSSRGSYTEPRGPDASREMIRFFLEAREIDRGRA